MSIVYENSLFRIRRLPREIRGEVEITPEVVEHIDSILMRGRPRAANRLVLSPDVLGAVGVSSAQELEVSVEDGRIVLTPKAAAKNEACSPCSGPSIP